MIEHTLDTEHSILYVRPKTSLEQDDFVQLAKTVDPYIEETGDLAGLIIEAPRSRDGKVSEPWRPTSGLFVIITSTSRKLAW